MAHQPVGRRANVNSIHLLECSIIFNHGVPRDTLASSAGARLAKTAQSSIETPNIW